MLSGCALVTEPTGKAALEPVAFDSLKGWRDDTGVQAALTAFHRGCDRLVARPPAKGVDWRGVCAALDAAFPADAAAARRFLETRFRPFAVADSGAGPDGLFTGYYEPELRGARRPGGRYRVALYARPDDLVTADLGRFDPSLAHRRIAGRVADGRLVPYPARSAIDAGALGAAAQPLVWVDDPVDAFFLHVQGSGRVALADGGVMRLGFAGTNGRPYTSIGRLLRKRGALADRPVTMTSIRSWLAANPARAKALMAENARYVFFRKLDGAGPVGALGVPLSPGRSLAVDPAALPLGAPIWLETTDPLMPDRPFRRLMVAQDTGGAIKGVVRGDVFFGHGRLAERRAGAMQQRGRYFVLLPRAP